MKKLKPMSILESLHNDNIIAKKIYVYGWENNGESSYYYDLYGSVNKYLAEPLIITEALIPANLDNRPSIIKPSTKYITIHDTAAAKKNSGATAHKNYVVNGGGGTSWHYSIGNDGIYHHLPNNEVAYHAGDGSRLYELISSGIKASRNNPLVTISSDGYYELDGIRSTVLAPQDNGKILSSEKINDLGIKVIVGEDNYYYIGNTWFSNTYQLIGNAGGNRNSIGIESCIDQGSDLYLTWQRLAKLVAYLLEEQNLTIDAVVQHHYFSGKDCPKTMRHANMWKDFLNLVEAELLVRKLLKNYSVSFISNSEYLDNNGRVIKITKEEIRVKYTIKITDKNNIIESKDFISILKPIQQKNIN